MTLTLNITREVRPVEVPYLVFGTGALSWGSWFHEVAHMRGEEEVTSADLDDIEETDTFVFTHWPNGEEQGEETTTLTLAQIVEAAGKALAAGNIDEESAHEMASDDLGMADAIAADIVLQYAIYGEIVYG